ncbi:MAG: hypothetical protein Q4F72_05045 [Desulfovibrionaceae bacterium]|nr:hypothetical protein [Desulfovibrionaceae bacterium]
MYFFIIFSSFDREVARLFRLEGAGGFSLPAYGQIFQRTFYLNWTHPATAGRQNRTVPAVRHFPSGPGPAAISRHAALLLTLVETQARRNAHLGESSVAAAADIFFTPRPAPAGPELSFRTDPYIFAVFPFLPLLYTFSKARIF